MSFQHNWGIPGINISPPPVQDGYVLTPTPQPYSRLQFTPVGLYDLRRRVGVPREPGIFQQYRPCWFASDLGWHAAGLSTDGNHLRTANTFAPEFDSLRESLPTGIVGGEARKALNERIQHLTFDMVRRLAFLFFILTKYLLR